MNNQGVYREQTTMVFNRITNFWKSFDIISKLFYGLTFIILCSLFIENHLFSISHELLSFREIDDVAFQSTIKRVHVLIDNMQFSMLFEINDYAYGWIFWAPIAILTYPLYLLGENFSIYWPIITAPRQISLLFGILSLYIIRKILLKNDISEKSIAITVLLFALFPTFGYFSLRFGTVNAVMFFSLLTFYLALKNTPSTSKGRFFIVLSLAVAGGIKLSGLLIAPLIFALVVLRYERESMSRTIRDLVISSLVFILLLIAFTNPALFTYPFNEMVGHKYLEILQHFIGITKIASGATDPYLRFFEAVFGSGLNFIAITMLFIGIILNLIKNKTARFDMLAIIAVILIASLYLFFNVTNGKSAGLYFTSISFLFLLGVIGWSGTRFGFIILVILLALFSTDLFNRVLNLNDDKNLSWHHLSYYIKKSESKDKLDTANDISRCINILNKKKWSGHVFVDFTLPTGFNALTYPRACISFAWNNLSPSGSYCPQRPVDFLVLDNAAPGYLPDQEFEEKLQLSDQVIAEGLQVDRTSRKNLIENGYFGNQKFTLVCEFDQAKIYKAVK